MTSFRLAHAYYPIFMIILLKRSIGENSRFIKKAERRSILKIYYLIDLIPRNTIHI